MASDHDPAVQKSLKTAMQNVFQANNFLFWDAWESIMPGDRKACSAIVGKVILNGRQVDRKASITRPAPRLSLGSQPTGPTVRDALAKIILSPAYNSKRVEEWAKSIAQHEQESQKTDLVVIPMYSMDSLSAIDLTASDPLFIDKKPVIAEKVGLIKKQATPIAAQSIETHPTERHSSIPLAQKSSIPNQQEPVKFSLLDAVLPAINTDSMGSITLVHAVSTDIRPLAAAMSSQPSRSPEDAAIPAINTGTAASASSIANMPSAASSPRPTSPCRSVTPTPATPRISDRPKLPSPLKNNASDISNSPKTLRSSDPVAILEDVLRTLENSKDILVQIRSLSILKDTIKKIGKDLETKCPDLLFRVLKFSSDNVFSD